jgi:hypothetical protein
LKSSELSNCSRWVSKNACFHKNTGSRENTIFGNILGDYISESDQKMGKVGKNKVEKH